MHAERDDAPQHIRQPRRDLTPLLIGLALLGIAGGAAWVLRNVPFADLRLQLPFGQPPAAALSPTASSIQSSSTAQPAGSPASGMVSLPEPIRVAPVSLPGTQPAHAGKAH